MSDGAAAIVPLAVLVLAPVVVLAAAGAAAVVYTGKGAAELARQAALAHQRSRVRVERARYRALVEHAGQLRITHPDPPPSATDTVTDLAREAGALRNINDVLAAELADQQQQLNALESDLAALRGRRATLERWRDEAALDVATASEPASDPSITAVAEATARLAAVQAANESLTSALREVHEAHAAEITAATWASLASRPTLDPDRDRQAPAERARQRLRAEMQRALNEAALTQALPAEVKAAWSAIETADDSTAQVAVREAAASLAEFVAHRATVRNFLAQLDALAAEAEMIQGFAILEGCDAAREEFQATTVAWDAVRLSAWANARVATLGDQVQRMKAARAQLGVDEAEAARAHLMDFTLEQVHDVLRELGHVSIPMETGRPQGGHLFVERAAVEKGSPGFGRVVRLAPGGVVETIPVRLGRAASTSGERADDEAWCAKQVDLDGEIFPELERRLRALVPGGTLLPDRIIDLDHYRGGSLENRILTEAQRRELADQVAAEHRQDRERTFD